MIAQATATRPATKKVHINAILNRNNPSRSALDALVKTANQNRAGAICIEQFAPRKSCNAQSGQNCKETSVHSEQFGAAKIEI